MRFLSKGWFNSHLEGIKSKARNRYTPKLHVELPISDIFDGIGRTKRFYSGIRTHYGNLQRQFRYVSLKYEEQEIEATYDAFSDRVNALLEALGGVKEYSEDAIPWETILKEAKAGYDLAWKLSEKLHKEKDKPRQETASGATDHRPSRSEKISSDLHHLYEAQKELRHLEEFAGGSAARLSNYPFLLLTGLAGTGKTHLLCDVVENRFKEPVLLPSVLVFGEFFTGKTDLWQQIAAQLGLKENYDRDKILRLLDNAGRRRSARSLLIIDALNESRPIRYWRRNLRQLYSDVRKYPHIGLVVSIRSGFEDEVMTKTARKLFLHEEHRGFQFREWEAVTKFFKEFSLPLPEIPLLLPEFQNPLFLLLFCKAFQNRSGKGDGKKQRQVFRGHEGATYIFENFVKAVADRLAVQFGLPKGRNANGDYVIWDTVIERVAAEMVEQYSDRIQEAKLIDIVKSEYPSVNHGNFLKEIEKNLLLIKVPRYSRDYKQVPGFDYRFPFQKFSDHLIARYIFRNFRKAKKTPRQFFAGNSRTGKFLKDNWNRGLVEALSIQCPEQLNGLEFHEIAPYLNPSMLIDAFIESLIWRKPDAFTADQKNALKFINKQVIRTESGHTALLNAFLSIASVPAHPFNALFLHKHLSKFAMPKRDAWWSTFLHYQYREKGAVDRLIEWGWSGTDKRHLKDDSIKLCSIALIWFLTTSNRFIRDKATKALVELLTDRLHLVAELVGGFKGVDDQYLLERLYAVAYGCALRNRTDKEGLKKLAKLFYGHFFEKGNIPLHVLARDHVRGVIEVAIDRKLVDIDVKKIRPPYGSRWPERIPSADALKWKFYPESFFKHETEDRGYLDIWSSVMYGETHFPGDFGKYVINPAVGHWSGRRLGGKDANREKLFEDFKRGLDKGQSEHLERFTSSGNIKVIIRYFDPKKPEDKAEMEAQEREEKKEWQGKLSFFKSALPPEKRTYFEKEIEPYLGRWGQINDPLEHFDTGLAQRWIFNRVVELGWTSELHGHFDKNVSYHRIDRTEHKAERIGKKYEWIALHEFIALLTDNFEFTGDRWAKAAQAYEGSWQIGVRDIDPSCTLLAVPEQQALDMPALRKHDSYYNAWRKKVADTTWLKTTSDLPDPATIIEAASDGDADWLAIEGFFEWQDETPPEQEKYNVPTRALWYIIRSYLVKKRDSAKVFDWAANQDFMGRWMPESHSFYAVYLGEYPGAPAFLYHYTPYFNHDGWTDDARNNKIPAMILVTDDQYQSSGSSIDCSTDEAIKVALPAKWIVDRMGLTQKHTDGRFFDRKGDLVAFDPSIFMDNIPRCLLIRKDKLSRFLEKNGYEIMWTLLGEKNMIGGGVAGQPLGWLEINGAYRLSGDDKITGQMRSSFQKSPN